MNKNPLFEKIEAFLSGELSEAEKRAFEAEIAHDSALAAEVDSHRKSRQVIDKLKEISLQDQIASWKQNLDDLPAPPSASKSGIPWRYLIALLLLLAVGAVWYWKSHTDTQQVRPLANEPTTSNDEALYSSRGKDENASEDTLKAPPSDDKPKKRLPTPTTPSSVQLIAMAKDNLKGLQTALSRQYGQTMGNNDDGEPRFEAALKSLKAKDTLAAIQQLEPIEPGTGYFSASRELLAMLYFSQHNYGAAVAAYEAFAAKKPYPEVDWRMAQFYLAVYETRKADFWRVMDKITAPDKKHPKKAEAEKLLKQLNLKK